MRHTNLQLLKKFKTKNDNNQMILGCHAVYRNKFHFIFSKENKKEELKSVRIAITSAN